MSARGRCTRHLNAAIAVIAWSALCSPSLAVDLLLADGRAFPGQVLASRDGAPARMVYRREATPNAAFPKAAMKLAAVTVGPDRKVYFASGLDGYVMHLLDRRHEVVSFEFDGQVRDLDCGNEEHTVYFSVVPTPQNNEPLADGKIYRRDIWTGQPSEVATIRQSQVGGNWWGTFAIRDGTIYLATLDSPSRIFTLTSGEPKPVFPASRFRITGLAAAADDNFYFSDETDMIYRTRDFEQGDVVLRGAHGFTDVALEPEGSAGAH